uniref:NADH:ubiquinone reductase (non-electrogenic) n=1 Tax=Solanum lycopersicum TaxID=4081 RepID=A0A3Q7GRS0_SOLLC
MICVVLITLHELIGLELMNGYASHRYKMYTQLVIVVVFLKVQADKFFQLWPKMFVVFDEVAERQGKYLASLLNKVGKEGGGHANCAQNINLGDPFVYKHLGSMATIGRYKALEAKGVSLAGFTSFFVWRSAYLTRVVSKRNKFYVLINWLTTLVFGRDISRI